MDCKLEQEIERKDALELYLDSIVDKRLHKEEQLELIEKINLKDGRGRQQKSISKMNKGLEMLGIVLKIKSKREDKIINGVRKSTVYWYVE